MSDPTTDPQRPSAFTLDAYEYPHDLVGALAQGDLDLAYELAVTLWILFEYELHSLRETYEEPEPDWSDLEGPFPTPPEPTLAVDLLSLEITLERWGEGGVIKLLRDAFPCLAAARQRPAQAGRYVAPSMTAALLDLAHDLSVRFMKPLAGALGLARQMAARINPLGGTRADWDSVNFAEVAGAEDVEKLLVATAQAPARRLQEWVAYRTKGLCPRRVFPEIEQEFYQAAALRRRLGFPPVGPVYEMCHPLRGHDTPSRTAAAVREEGRRLDSRLQFDPASRAVTLDDQPFEGIDPVPFLILREIANAHPRPLAEADLRAAHALKGKNVRRELRKLPAPLLALVQSRPGFGRWLALPPREDCP
jgi:hypothetical protein